MHISFMLWGISLWNIECTKCYKILKERNIPGEKKGNINKASRIDFMLVSAGLDQNVKAIQFLPGIKTDHRALYAVFDLQYAERGVGFWKFNCQLLKDKEFVELMNREIELCITAARQKNPKEKWEIIKQRVKKVTREYARNKVAERKIIIAQLSEEICDYESKLPLNKEEDEILQKSKLELEELLAERVRAIMFRSKVKWYEEGEKSTKYFFSLEKAKYNAKTCYKILSQNDIEVTDPQQILQKQKLFYQNLYSKDEDVCFDMKNEYQVQVLYDVKVLQCQQVNKNDLKLAMKGMSNNKTPGNDGIPIDFYKVFWNYLELPFYDMMKQCYEENIMHDTARMGILNLIPKPNKDSRYIKNLRPITLLNADYKIIEKAVANKMLPALQHIISKDQRGFMKERRISVNIRKLLDIMYMTEIDDLEAVVLSLDFVKCFDKCSFTILHGSLEFFGFGDIVKEWTKILYTDFSVKIQNNGHFSESIDIKKGVHQGGCASAIYFLVIAEILALSLKDNKDIEGLTIRQIRELLNQFADDMDVFSVASEKSLKTILEELDRFRYQSGFTVSYDKTTLYRIGSLRHSDAQMYDMRQYTWSNKDINVLGITISHEGIVEKNYEPLIGKTKKVLEVWYNRGLSLIGKVQVINTLVASLFVYKMMVLPTIPPKVVKQVDNLCREYIWNGKKAKIAYPILQNPKKHGGLNLANLLQKDIALKATWPTILAKEPEYESLVYIIMRCSVLQRDVWRANFLPEHVSHLGIKNQFWCDVLKSWAHYNFNQNFREENQIIWQNSHYINSRKNSILERCI